MLAFAIACIVELTAGSHPLECRAEYLHTLPDGTRYMSVIGWSQWLNGPAYVTCSGEGHPFKVTLKDLGAVVCSAEEPLFEDGFESGDATAWTSEAP